MEHALSPFVTDFFTKLGIVVTSIHIDQAWEDIDIRVETPDSALLIGMHGKNIEIFQHLQPIRMPSLTPYERKKAHGYIADKNIVGLKTQSEWEWISRSLILSYTGELKKGIVSAPIPPTKIVAHTEMSISDEGVGI